MVIKLRIRWSSGNVGAYWCRKYIDIYMCVFMVWRRIVCDKGEVGCIEQRS